MNPTQIIPQQYTGKLNYELDENEFKMVVESTIPSPFDFMDDTFEQLDRQHFVLVEKVIGEYQEGKTISEEEFFLKLKESTEKE